MKLLPGITNFLKSNNIVTLDSFKADIYTLKKKRSVRFGIEKVQVIFSYKIKDTKYIIYSTKRITPIKKGKLGKSVFENGFIQIKKGFKTVKLDQSQLPSEVTNSISGHMNIFNKYITKHNEELKEQEVDKNKTDLTEQEKLKNFLNNLDI